MSEHTPGPWRQYAPVVSGKRDRNYRAITGGDGVFLDKTGFELTGFIRESDARLMAAAPELLEKLEWMCNIVQHPAATKASMRQIAMACREVIRKATEGVPTNDQD